MNITKHDVSSIARSQRILAGNGDTTLSGIKAECSTSVGREGIELGQRRVVDMNDAAVSQETIGETVRNLTVVYLNGELLCA